jgi:hypothetical protein
MRGAARWLLEGLGVALFAAGVFAAPWLWVTLFPPPGPYTLAIRPRIGPRLPSPEPLNAPGRFISGQRAPAPTPLPDQKLIFIDLRHRPQTLTAYEGMDPVMEFRVSGSRLATDDVGYCRIRAKSLRHLYQAENYWMEWWMTLQPLSAEGMARAKVRGYNGIHATDPKNYGLLGSPASHGCVRLRRREAQQLWEWAEEGAPVFIYKFSRQRGSLPTPVVGQDPSRYRRAS